MYRQVTMKRKFFRSGNGWAIYVKKAIIELLKINPEEDYVEISIKDNVLLIKKINK